MSGAKTLLFGGSFDPPHQGHMALLHNAILAVEPDKVLVIPSGESPHKDASETPGTLRMAMCACFESLFPGLVVSDIEQRRQGKSYTVDTLAELKAENPKDDFYLCVGGDMLLSFTAWREWQRVLRLATLVATGRGEAAEEELQAAAAQLCEAGGQVIFAAGPQVKLSSTGIRAAIAAGQSVTGLIPPPADSIVEENRLYR